MSIDKRIERLRERGLLPYQAEFVDAALTGSAKRLILSAPVGAGMGVAAAALIAEASAERPLTRALILCPASLSLRWQDLLTDRLLVPPQVMTAGLYRRLQEEDAARPNPWQHHPTFIASYDFAKSSDRMESLLQAEWTLVVCDEIHGCGGQRAKLVQRLWASDLTPLCVGLTAFSQQVDRSIMRGATSVVWDAHSLKDWDGRPLFRSRRTFSAAFHRTAEEKEFRSALFGALSQIREARDDLARQVLVASANSSLYAIEQTLRRLLAQSSEVTMLLLQERDDSVPLGRSVAELVGADALGECLQILERVPSDAKLAAARQLISDWRHCDPSSIIVFTQFKDTAYYVSSNLAADDIPAECLTGDDELAERAEKIEKAKRQPCVLVCTDAMAEGVDMSFAHRVVHYDIPWNPTTLEQRLGRVMRVSQARELEIATLSCEDADDAESDLPRRLAERLEQIRFALGGGD